MKRAFMEERLIVYLMILKITPNLKGYRYIKEAAMLVCENGANTYRTTKNLFKEIAEIFGEKQTLLDRALRHAIEVSYKRDGIEAFEKATNISFFDDKPSVKDVVYVLAEKLSIDLRMNSLI